MPDLWFDSFYASDFYKVNLYHPVFLEDYAYQTTEMAINTAATYSSPTGQPGEGVVNNAASVFGKSAIIDAFTTQTWQGTEPIDLTFNFALIGIRNSAYEVVQKARNLARWPLPIKAEAFTLVPPVDSTSRCCDVETKYLYIHDCLLPVSVNITFSSTLDKTGYPVRADVIMNFRTHKAVLVEDFMSWFKV